MATAPSGSARRTPASYDRTIGYSDLDKIDPNKAKNTIAIAKEIIEGFRSIRDGDKVLVAGCGNGIEADLLCQVFGTPTVGVDLAIQEDATLFDGKLELRRCDLSRLPYQSETFSLIYSYHVLEHVPNHNAVLRELGRVLKPGGILFIGFPNKHRLVMYLGSHQRVTLRETILWNLNDYQRRCRGSFENHLGAHAGFTQKEFIRDARSTFATIIPVRNEYMKIKYRSHRYPIHMIIKMKMGELLFPSNYFICQTIK